MSVYQEQSEKKERLVSCDTYVYQRIYEAR